MERACRRADLARNPGARLAALLAHAVEAGGTLFIETDDRLRDFDDWLAQLIAESTGKNGRGLLPVRTSAQSARYRPGDIVFMAGETTDARVATLEALGCAVVRCAFTDRHAIAAEFVRWEVGVALACSLIEVNAFDEPDVAIAKRATAAALAEGASSVPASAEDLARAIEETDDMRFIAIHAYLERTRWTETMLGAVQQRLRERSGLPVAVDFGPALLHATGQYYKGGPDGGLFFQIVEPGGDLGIPGREYGFGTLLAAQAHGDAQAMRDCGRRVVSTTFAALRAAVEAASTPLGRGAR